MKFTNFIFLIILIAIVIIISYFFCTLKGMEFLSWKNYQFSAFIFLGIVIYSTSKFFRLIDSISAVFFLSILNSYFLLKTPVSDKLHGFFYLFVYSVILFYLIFLSFKFIWYNNKIRRLRNIIFSITSAISYTFIRYISDIISQNKLNYEIIKQYFIYSFLIWLIISFSFSLTEIIFAQLENIWKMPERIDIDNNSEEEE